MKVIDLTLYCLTLVKHCDAKQVNNCKKIRVQGHGEKTMTTRW